MSGPTRKNLPRGREKPKGLGIYQLTPTVGVFFSASNGTDYYQMFGIVNQVNYSPGTDTHSVWSLSELDCAVRSGVI